MSDVVSKKVHSTQNVFREDDFSDRSVQDVNSDGFNAIYEIEPEKGSGLALGRGNKSNQVEAEGRIYADIQNSTPNQLFGKIRFEVRTKQDHLVTMFNTFDLEEIDEGVNTRKDRVPFPLQRNDKGNIVVAYPYKLVIAMKTDSSTGSDTVDTLNTTLKLDGYTLEAKA